METKSLAYSCQKFALKVLLLNSNVMRKKSKKKHSIIEKNICLISFRRRKRMELFTLKEKQHRIRFNRPFRKFLINFSENNFDISKYNSLFESNDIALTKTTNFRRSFFLTRWINKIQFLCVYHNI